MPSQADAVARQLEQQVANACKALILEIDANLRAATPVDTGHARASWVPSIGNPSAAEPQAASSAEHDTGVGLVLRYQLKDGDLWVSNNAPYITLLNLGHSNQAPAGFFEVAIDQAQQTIQARYDGLHIDITLQGAGTFSDFAGGRAAENLAEAYSPFRD